MDLKCCIEFFLFKKTDVMYFESMKIENSFDLINGLMRINSNNSSFKFLIFTLKMYCNIYFVKDKLCTVVVATNVKIIIHG